MQKDFADTSAEGITEDMARSWIAGLVIEERSAYTVREVWLSASQTVFGWGLRHKRVSKNPFSDVYVDVPKKIRLRETKAFRPEEAVVIFGRHWPVDTRRQCKNEHGAGCLGCVPTLEPVRAR